MAKFDFKLVRRFSTTRIKKENVSVTTDGKHLFIKIPIACVAHKPTNPETEFRAIKGDSTAIPLLDVDIYLEPNVRVNNDGGVIKEDTSTTKLTAVIEFDTKKPQNEPL